VVSHEYRIERMATARLSLRRPSIRDLDAIFAITSDPRATFHNPSDAITTGAEAIDLFERWEEQWDRYGFGYWTVRMHDRPQILGFCGVKVMQFQGSTMLNLFYRLDPAVWSRGIASEAATAVVAWAGASVPGCTIIARVRPGNLASQRVALKAGLRRAPDQDVEGFDGTDWIFTSR
jgi:[ribosomal protein S5]-alanine N-acetyltransferase